MKHENDHTETMIVAMNPLAQILGTFFITIPIFLSLDAVTPLLCVVSALPLFLVFFKPSFKTWLPFLIPLGILSIGTGMTNVCFSVPPKNQIAHVFFSLGLLRITDFSIQRAISIFSRTAALTVLSSLCAVTINPIELINSLMQNAKISPRWAFALYAGINLLPSMKEDLSTMKHARRIRLKGKNDSLKHSISLPVFLLTAAIRRSERIAISMECRGIEEAEERTFVKKSIWRKNDFLFIFLSLAQCITSLAVSIYCKLFSFNLG